MFFKKREVRPFILSHSSRELIYSRMLNEPVLGEYLRNDLVSITKLLLTLDTVKIRQQVKEYLLSGKESKLKSLANKIPFAFDEKGYETLGVYLLINRSGMYFLILSEDVKYSKFTFVEVLKANSVISLEGFVPIIQIYPL